MRPWYRLLLVVLASLMVSGCAAEFRLAELSPGQIPAEARGAIEQAYKGHPLEDMVWRACYEQGDYTIVWLEQEIASDIVDYSFNVLRRDKGGKLKVLAIDRLPYGRDESGQLTGFGKVSDRTYSTLPYGWSHGHGGSASDDIYIGYASGVAFSSRAHKVVGELTNGHKVEELVVNGFWCLIADSYGDPVKVVVRDRWGWALATFEKGQ